MATTETLQSGYKIVKLHCTIDTKESADTSSPVRVQGLFIYN